MECYFFGENKKANNKNVSLLAFLFFVQNKITNWFLLFVQNGKTKKSACLLFLLVSFIPRKRTDETYLGLSHAKLYFFMALS